MENLKKQIAELLNLYNSKNLIKAEELNKKLISNYPRIAYLYNLQGLILSGQNRYNEAITSYKKGIRLDPKAAWICNNLGSTLHSIGYFKEAEHFFKKSIILDKKMPESENNLGNLNLALNKYRKAITCFKNAVNINPKFYASHYNLGLSYKRLGMFKEAKDHLIKATKLNPNLYSAHRTLSQITKYKLNNDHFNLLKKIYKDPKIKANGKAEIAFALGKASEDMQDYHNAFKYFAEGNSLRRENIFFSIKKEKEEFNSIKNIFHKDFLNKKRKIVNLDSKAIFIIGMPRSGTTLVEQILSSHSKVYGGDELVFLPNLIDKNFHHLSSIANLNDKKFSDISKDYIDKINILSDHSERVTDKLPINFKWVGLIKLLLPKSKIIHCVRNPKDNCLSIFKNYFTNTQLNFAYDLNELCEFYKMYQDLIMHWKTVLPNFIYEIKYEDLIKNSNKEIKNLIAACDLNWDEKCLKFYENKRPIKTASDSQVRSNIYKSSVNSWKNYEADLKIFFNQL